MKQTKHSRKSEAQNCVQNVHHSREHMHSNDYAIAQSLPWWCHISVVQQPPLPQQTFFQLLHTMDSRTVDPLLKDTSDAVIHRIQIWRIGWPHLWRDILWCLSLEHGDCVTCTVNGMISVTSTLRHQVRDVHRTQRSKFTRMISIHLQSCVPKIIKIRVHL